MLDATLGAVVGLGVGRILNVVTTQLPLAMERQWRRESREMVRDEMTQEADRTRFDALLPTADKEDPHAVRWKGSGCPQCAAPARGLENVPLLGWLLRRGRCSSCSASLSAREPLVELLSGVATAAAIAVFGPTLLGFASVVLCWVLIVAAFIDAETTLLPDDLTLPLLWGGLLLNTMSLFAPLHEAVVGAAAGYLSLWMICAAFKLLTGREGMGHGDFKLLAALGAWFGWKALPAIVLLSSVVGALIGIALLLLRSQRQVQIPFGPYLAGAGLLTLYFGQPLMALYGLL